MTNKEFKHFIENFSALDFENKNFPCGFLFSLASVFLITTKIWVQLNKDFEHFSSLLIDGCPVQFFRNCFIFEHEYFKNGSSIFIRRFSQKHCSSLLNSSFFSSSPPPLLLQLLLLLLHFLLFLLFSSLSPDGFLS